MSHSYWWHFLTHSFLVGMDPRPARNAYSFVLGIYFLKTINRSAELNGKKCSQSQKAFHGDSEAGTSLNNMCPGRLLSILLNLSKIFYRLNTRHFYQNLYTLQPLICSGTFEIYGFKWCILEHISLIRHWSQIFGISYMAAIITLMP